MAFWQRRSLIRQETLTPDSGTRRLTLPKSNFLSALELRLAWDNYTSRNTETIIDAIDRVEVIADGSKVLFSMRGAELFAWNWFHLRRPPKALISEDPADTQFVHLLVPFGRVLADPQFALDLSKFSDVELRLQYSPTIAAGGFATGTGVLDVDAWMYMDGPLPLGHAGFFRTTEVFSFTSAASGEERVELPRRFPYRRLMVRAAEAGIEDGTDITEVELDINSGARIQFSGRWLHLQEENAHWLDLVPIIDQILFLSNDDTADLLMTRIQNVDLAVTQAADVAGDRSYHARVDAIAGNRITIDAYVLDVTAGAEDLLVDAVDRRVRVRAQGISVPYSVLIPFDLNGDLELALDPRQFDSVELVLTQGGAGADVRIILQEIVPAGVDLAL